MIALISSITVVLIAVYILFIVFNEENDRECKDIILSEDFDEEIIDSICDFIDERCIVRDKNCNVYKTNTHVVTDEKGAKQILIDMIED